MAGGSARKGEEALVEDLGQHRGKSLVECITRVSTSASEPNTLSPRARANSRARSGMRRPTKGRACSEGLWPGEPAVEGVRHIAAISSGPVSRVTTAGARSQSRARAAPFLVSPPRALVQWSAPRSTSPARIPAEGPSVMSLSNLLMKLHICSCSDFAAGSAGTATK